MGSSRDAAVDRTVDDAPALDVVAPRDVVDAAPMCRLDLDCADTVPCTVDVCRDGRCSHTPSSALCPMGSSCDAQRGCRPQRSCTSDTDCADTDECTVRERCDPIARVCFWDELPAETPCGAAGSGRLCLGGACACPTSRPTVCNGRCFDTRADPDHCGTCNASCGAGSWCSAGRCACPAPQSWCPRVGCTDLTSDNGNCGACANTCGSPARCETGRCVAPCPMGTHRCGNDCTSDMSPASCGTRCTPCVPPAGATAVCVNATCDFTCPASTHRCSGRCEPNDALATCGSRCTPCPAPAHGTAACMLQVCAYACDAGYHLCGDQCGDNGSPLTCGSRCSPCPTPANATATCAAGTCDFTCNTGYHRCGDVCSDGTSPLGCGLACTRCPVPAHSVATCTAGACGFTCSAGYHLCGGVCVDDRAPETCGTRCTPCAVPANARGTCITAMCGFECAPGYVRDGDACRELPRPLWPPSTSTVTSRRPTLRWRVPAAAPGDPELVAEVCRDRACAMVLATIPGASGTGVPTVDLPRANVFWRLRAGTRTSAVWTFTVSGTGGDTAPPGLAWGASLDLNRDGFGDVAVGAPFAATPGARVHVYPGSAAGLQLAERVVLEAPSPMSQFGAVVTPGGDVNGDGFGDLLVSAPAYSDNSGRVYVFYGTAAGVNVAPDAVLDGPDGGGGFFGAALSSAGDVNGDGYGDVIGGARSASDAGRAYVFHGSSTGLSVTPAATLSGPAMHLARFGTSVASLGDVDGDGDSDVVVGSDGYDGFTGRAYVYYGASTGVPTTASVVLSRAEGGQFGAAVMGVGDGNGDGYPDFGVGSPSLDSSRGQLSVFRGGAMGVAMTAAQTINGPGGTQADFASVLSALGDVNGDGYADLGAGAPRIGDFTGQAYVFYGGAMGFSATPSQYFVSFGGPGSFFGGAFGGGRDLDNDGFADAIISSERYSMFAGQITLLFGSTSGLSRLMLVESIDGRGSRYGFSIASREGRSRFTGSRAHASARADLAPRR